MSKEVEVRKLLQACEKDPELLKKLVEQPQAVAKEHNIALEPEELQQLQRVRKLKDLVDEFKAGRVIGHPIGYPVDVLWKKTLANHILSDRAIFYPIFYGWGPIYYVGSYPVWSYPFYNIGYPRAPEATRQFSGLRFRGGKRRP